VAESGLPVAWAPGQGIVEYPARMGFPLKTTDKLVIQPAGATAPPCTCSLRTASTVSSRSGYSGRRRSSGRAQSTLLRPFDAATESKTGSGQVLPSWRSSVT